MQITHSQGQYIEREMRTPQGVLVRATFFVYQNAGRMRARLVSITPLAAATKIVKKAGSFLALPGISIKIVILPLISSVFKSVSDITRDTVALVISQPTRAPSFV